jgi:hypothetical protein
MQKARGNDCTKMISQVSVVHENCCKPILTIENNKRERVLAGPNNFDTLILKSMLSAMTVLVKPGYELWPRVKERISDILNLS